MNRRKFVKLIGATLTGAALTATLPFKDEGEWSRWSQWTDWIDNTHGDMVLGFEDRHLTDEEMRSLYENPWQIFKASTTLKRTESKK